MSVKQKNKPIEAMCVLYKTLNYVSVSYKCASTDIAELYFILYQEISDSDKTI